MTRKRFGIPIAALALALAAAAAQAADGDPAAKLSADNTIVYARMDTRELLDKGEQVLRFVDEESGRKVIHQVKALHRLIQEVAAKHEFQPQLFDDIADVQFHFVLMAKDEPEVKVHKFEVPVYDDETGEVVAGKTEEHSQTETSYFTPSFVLKTSSPEVSTNFMAEFKAFLDRKKEENPESDEFNRKDIEVEKGELITDVNEETMVGCLDEYLVFSQGNPKELWAALVAPQANPLSETAGYKRLVPGDNPPQTFVLVNLEALVNLSEQRLKTALEEARKKYAEEGGEEQEGWNPSQFEVTRAENSYKSFLTAKQLFSLDKCKQSGAAFSFSAEANAVTAMFRGLFTHGEGISPILAEILESPAQLTVPDIGKPDTGCIMFRVRPKVIYDAVLNVLAVSNPESAATTAEAMLEMKQQIGTNLPEIFELFAGNFYLFVDVERKEVEKSDYQFNEETEEWESKTTKSMELVPEPVFLCGVTDAQVARDLLSTIFAQMSMNPMFNQFIKKRTYQEADVYCMGPGAAKPDADPTKAGAAVVVDRYLSLGTWDHVTGLIRRFKSGKIGTASELQGIVEKHGNANFLFIIPKAFDAKVRSLAEQQAEDEEEDPFKKLLEEGIGELMDELLANDIADEATAQEIEEALTELVQGLKDISEKADMLMPQTTVIHGAHSGLVYEVRGDAELRK